MIALFLVISKGFCMQDQGYGLWFDYRPVTENTIGYTTLFQQVHIDPEISNKAVIQNEIELAAFGMLSIQPEMTEASSATLTIIRYDRLNKELLQAFDVNNISLKPEGFAILPGSRTVLITALDDAGLLYGTYRFLQRIQSGAIIKNLKEISNPKVKVRILNHWDNLDRTVERGYAGSSIWNWHKLPEYKDPRYTDYARANASIGINSTVLTNVNANALVLTPDWIKKVKALADIFRPYGIRVYLTARFSAPMEIGNLQTADPLDPAVKKWWADKCDELYKLIPDFGGFLVKANSEGQPGPQNYGRTHAEGANMLADALAPHGGIVMWRAFVYSEHDRDDRAKQAFSEFVPLDGTFRKNVLLQVKNGPIDFQPREPFHPMFGAMPKTNMMPEFQITQEYLGFSTHLVFLPKLFEETLDADTYRQGSGSTVSKVTDGSMFGNALTGMAGVSNIGSDINWTGHPFAQANWYGFGRLAWDPYLDSATIAREWLALTYSQEPAFLDAMTPALLQTRETVVKYMTPLGLHHIMNAGHHYGPGPWIDQMSRDDWNSVYYHKADSTGLGFDRSSKGSNATSQYAQEIASLYNDIKTCPEELLLWFHHVPWNYKMKNGETLWNSLGITYQEGVDEVANLNKLWQDQKKYVPEPEFNEVSMLLEIQYKEACWWRDACMTYFQKFSHRPFPEVMGTPEHDLNYYKSLEFPYAPGIRPKWN
ncbi:alpha-glucuronidase family glycosyl hydrolase [Robertkochia solimangrovi]|uniref:alpha-glucuronidase family glycosyl hydrolase n=1 Tax=Robertkochia solimangrovi TaxID=2213046 RepID=UPI00118039DA|nr:alpha-glucuronidase family glycosyl hydrolase [Robertkochia solimangrovi]TRZ42499.1 alpha-glucuronidase [Robertkochia solimangrovi]